MAATNTRLAFTVQRLARLPVPDEGRVYYYDVQTPGLTCCVTSTNVRTFYLYRKIRGRPCRIRIERTDRISLADARERAKRLVGDIANGKDPHAERVAARGEMQFGELFERYIEGYAKHHKLTWAEDQRAHDRYLAGWKKRPLSTIHKSNVAALHARVGKNNGLYAANRLRTLLHGVFAYAGDLGFEGANPVKGVKPFKEQQRERFLHPDEFPKFWAALDAEPSETCRDFFKVCLLTGARRGNVLRMRWEELNLDRAEWRIPQTKIGEPLTVVLAPEAVEVLRRRQAAIENGCPWVFEGHHHGKHLKDPTKPWKSILARAGLSDLRVHDLRRTLGSWQAAGGSSLLVIGKSLGHKRADTTMIYSRLNLDPVRESVTKAVAAMMATAKPQKGGKRRGKK